MKSYKRVIACMVFCLITLSLVLSATAFAVNQECQLSIDYQYDGEAIAGADFHIYHAGDVLETGELNLIGGFANYPVEINGLNNSEFQSAAQTLHDYAMMDNLSPDRIVTTDDNGYVRVENLEQGLYLVVGQLYAFGDEELVSKPQVVVLPYRESSQDAFEYHVVMKPKCSIKTEMEEPITLKVLKQWDDNGNEKFRPASITVYLMNGAEVFDTVELTEENNWRHTWRELDPLGDWSVVEDVPENYTVVVRQEGITFLVVNSYDVPPPPDDPPPDIPQTGLLWWPVPVLAIIGVVLIAVGCISRRKRHDDA